MINVYELITKSLDQLEIPIRFLFYDDNDDLFITFFSYYEREVNFSNNVSYNTEMYFQIDIWDKHINLDILEKVKKIMKEIGFIELAIGPDLFHEDLETYQKPIRFLFLI